MSMTLPAFTPAQESLFLTLAGRALDSRLPHHFLGDTMAEGILRKTGSTRRRGSRAAQRAWSWVRWWSSQARW